MRPVFLLSALALVTLASGCSSVGPATAKRDAVASVQTIANALANPARSDADRERDAREHPADVLALASFGPGMTIADIFGGGGYYSEILSGIVGPRGHVLLVNNASYDNYVKKELPARLAGGRLANVDYRLVPNEAMNLGTATLDGAMIVMSYHDLYVDDPANNWPGVDASQFIDQIVSALKPDGRLLIVDHSARAGTGSSAAQTLHRIDEEFAKSDFAAHGLTLVAASDVLRNPADDRSKHVFNKEIRYKTDRFVQVYQKSAARH